jgi:hypothetical protein
MPATPLTQFAFLVGKFQCEARVELPTGEWQTFQATWQGRYILDGHVIEDEYCMIDATGKVLVLGLNFRVYDATRQVWNIKWLDALSGTWTDLGPEALGGVTFDGQSITYAFKEPMVGHPYTRATYTNISATHFTWRGEKSADRNTWTEFMIIECHRTSD